MKLFVQLSLLAFVLVLAACSTSQQTTETKSDPDQEIYVFDDVGTADTAEVITTEPVVEDTIAVVPEVIDTTPKFFVQVGAFTTMDRAQAFVSENQGLINWDMNISYSDKVQLFVVQLPTFNTRTEAEYVRNQLWQTEVFKDAFIVP